MKLILKIFFSSFFAIASVVWAQGVVPDNKKFNHSFVAIIIDDLGYKIKQDKRAIQLPGNVTYAFLPYTPHVKEMTEIVHARGNEIMLHLPMQSNKTLSLGPGALTNRMNEYEFRLSVLKSILSIPHVKGINNHMGSLMTSQQKSMNWLMDEINRTNLFFVDSRTSMDSVAEQTANQYAINNTRRNIFLDHELDRHAIEFQFNRLIELSKKNGSAVAIGHPFDITLDVLEEKIPQLKKAGIQLIKVSSLIHQQSKRKTSVWQASLSPSQPAVKSLKQ
ncbi:MAG: divergent polysaccharide deacetylase family protein [gamma proteobacterium symbiont of Taylorina sp.]|nr:divergent polysaccharide deacetylase family protein [gamma proteobacterium symbiont of Taylorina sp.]